MKYWLSLMIVAICAPLWAAEIKVAESTVPTNSYAEVSLTGTVDGDNVAWDVSPDPTKINDLGNGGLFFSGPPGAKFRVIADVVNFKTQTRKRYRTDIQFAGAPLPPPTPPPGPNPPTPPVPTPDPLKSFRVFLIYESANPLSPEDRAVVYGKVVEDYLNANCTGGKTGWRRRDKDAPGEADPTMSALWNSVRSAVTVTPCIAIERNGKVEILNLEATPAKQIETLQRYRGN